VSIIVVVPVGKIHVYEAVEEYSPAGFREHGGFRRFHLATDKIEVTYGEFLQKLLELREEYRWILLECDYADSHSFSVDYRYSTEDGGPKPFLMHKALPEGQVVELRLVRGSSAESRTSYYYLTVLNTRISEGTYLANPEFYDEQLGLRTGEDR
jgi:hypothetical protein